MRALAASLFLVLAAPTLGQDAEMDDPRYLEFNYHSGTIFHLQTSPDTNQTVLFAQGERIELVILSDPETYFVHVSGSGDSLALRARARPGPVLMSVRTQSRRYELQLVPGSIDATPQVVRFSYTRPEPQSEGNALPPEQRAGSDWRLTGDSELRPAVIADDGEKTYIAWADDQAMPAVFAIGPTGEEEMVNGYVRAGQFTIDRVHDELVFRIDRKQAKARRMARKERTSHE